MTIPDTGAYLAAGLQELSNMLKERAPEVDATTPPSDPLAPPSPIPQSTGPSDGSDRSPLSWGGFRNGFIPRDALQALSSQPNHFLEPGAASAFDRMVADAAAAGITIRITDSYRSYDAQVDVHQRKPALAARPGTSIHGWGRAIDVSGDDARRWVQQNGWRYGWIWPDWARPGGSKPEPWHFEFRPGT